MNFVRQLDWDRPEMALPHGYKGKFLYSGEDCHVVATLVPPGAKGPPQHKHLVDQIYVIISGTITIQLGEQERTAGPGDTIFIPAGLPHHNWNDGASDELHIEVIAPGVLPTQPLGVAAESDGDGGLPWLVRSASAEGPPPEAPGITNAWLITRDDKSEHATIYLSSLEPATRGPSTRILTHHQLYYVIEGRLSLEIALERHETTAGTLISIPPGVPHRFWNAGDELERHVSIVVPSPSVTDDAGAIPVMLTPTEPRTGARDTRLSV